MNSILCQFGFISESEATRIPFRGLSSCNGGTGEETGAFTTRSRVDNIEQRSLQAGTRQTYLNLRYIVRIFDDAVNKAIWIKAD
jgi:hypothetical protein